MKLYNFKGIETSFEIEFKGDVIIVDYIDYTLTKDGIDIHTIEMTKHINLNDLAERMLDYVDWELIEQREWERNQDFEEMYHEGN